MISGNTPLVVTPPKRRKRSDMIAARIRDLISQRGLSPGDRIPGPAVIVERETSTVVTSPFDVVMQGDGSLLLIRKEVQA